MNDICYLQEVGGPSARREGMRLLGEQFRGALFAYDEGLMGDDRELAATIWRIFFEMEVEDPERVEKLVHYVRKQVGEEGWVGLNFLYELLPWNLSVAHYGGDQHSATIVANGKRCCWGSATTLSLCKGSQWCGSAVVVAYSKGFLWGSAAVVTNAKVFWWGSAAVVTNAKVFLWGSAAVVAYSKGFLWG